MRFVSRSTVMAASVAAALVVPLKAADPAVIAPDLEVDLSYEVYFGGMHVAGLAVDIGLQPDAYIMKMHLKTVGFVGRLFPWWMKAYSRGRVAANDVTPLEAGNRNQWRGKDRWIELKYKGPDVEISSAEPKPAEDGRHAVSEDMRRDTIDLASAILRVALSMQRGAKCSGSIPIFDGRRRYDMVLTHRVTERIKASRYSAFDGRADSCTVKMKRIGGFKRPEQEYDDDRGEEAAYEESHVKGRGWRDADRSASVWMGKVFNNTPPLPVRLELDTPYGSLKAHLNHAELGVDGAKRRVVRRK